LNSKTRLIISILFIISIGLAIAVTRFSFPGNYKGLNVIATPDIQSVTNITYNNYTVFKSSENLYGVIDNNERVIIEPIWNDIIFTSSGKMIVSKNIDNNYYSGVIDNQDNILIPCIYSEFEEVNKDVIIGYLYENNNIVVFNGDFLPYINEEWDRCVVNNNFIFLYKDSIRYMGRIKEGKLDLIKMDVSGSIMDKPFKLSVYGDKYKINSNYKLMQEIFNISLVVFEQLFKFNYENLDINNSNIIQNASMKDYEFLRLYNVAFDICEDIYSRTNYRLNVDFQCIPKSNLDFEENFQNKLDYTISICIIKDRNGKLTIKSIDKKEIAK